MLIVDEKQKNALREAMKSIVRYAEKEVEITVPFLVCGMVDFLCNSSNFEGPLKPEFIAILEQIAAEVLSVRNN